MKKIVLLLLCSSMFLQCTKAQRTEKTQPATATVQPKKVYSYSRVQRPEQWYKEQSEAWKQLLEKNPQDANAWYNYYYAMRLLVRFGHGANYSQEEQNKIFDKISADMEKAVPGTYEYNMVRWLIGGSNMEYFPYLQKAKELAPERTEYLDGFINASEINRNLADRDMYSKQKFEASELSEGMLNYNHNMLAGLEQGAILITAGDNDTYPAWALQSLGVRKDIQVINIHLLQIDEYREKLFKELGIAPWEKLWGTVHSANGASLERYEKGILRHIANNSKGLPLYVASTASHLIDRAEPPIQDDMYLTGLAIRYSKENFDNMAALKRNFEQEYALDYLDKGFYVDISADLVKTINVNYVVPMLKLYDHYKASGDAQRMAWIEKKLRHIAKGTQAEEDVNKHLGKG